MHGQGFDIRHRPTHPRRCQLERADLWVIGNLRRIDRPPNTCTHRKPKRVTCGQNHHAFAAQCLQLRNQGIKGARPFHPLSAMYTDHLVMPLAADDNFCRLHHRTRGGHQPIQAIFTDAHDMQPCAAHGCSSGKPADRALTAADAMAEPPRRPRSATNSQPRALAANSALDSAAPTKPTGKPRITAGFGAP